MAKSRQEIIDDGNQAERLLKDTDLTRFLDEMRANCWVEFEATELNDKEGREAVYLKLRGIEYVRQSLKIMVDNASIEKKVK
tara:strand:+ start:759 stop:1004 length:246 start_codon:yes stop_codon:yes gene_type:complete